MYVERDYAPNSKDRLYYLWFHFKVKGIEQNSNVIFYLKNVGNQARLLSFGFKPVFKNAQTKGWKRIEGKFEYKVSFIISSIEEASLYLIQSFI